MKFGFFKRNNPTEKESGFFAQKAESYSYSENLSPPQSANFSSHINNKKKPLLGFLSVITLLVISVPIAKSFYKPAPFVQPTSEAVLGAQTSISDLQGTMEFNIPAVFNDDVTFNKGITVEGDTILNGSLTVKGKKLDLGSGTLNASNVLYGITAGSGLAVTTGQNPTLTNTGVTSLQGKTGDLTLTAGNGISISGTTISNTQSSPNTFGTISDGTNSFTAGATNDTVSFIAGSGVTISTDTTNKKLTFSSTGGSGGLSGLTTNGVLYANSSTTATSLTPGTSGYILQSNGAGSPPSWISSSNISPSFDKITTGTNTSATMTLGTGSSLTYTGTGIVNANELNGQTTSLGGTLTTGGSFTTSGAFGLTLTLAGTTNVTLPTTGTLSTLAGIETLTNKTLSASSNTISGLTNANLSGAAGITNGNLASSSITVNTGSGLSGGGLVSLGGTLNLSNSGVLSLAGTANQISASAGTGSITLSLPQDINTTSSPTFAGLTLNGDVTLGQNNSNTITPNGEFNSSLIPTGATINLGSLVNPFGAVYANNFYQNGISLTQYWQLNNGALAPLNITNDLLVGGIATASAKFQVSGTTGNIAATGNITGLTGLTSSGTIQFSGLTNGIAHFSSNGTLSSSPINLVSDITNILGVSNGGTGVTNLPLYGVLYGNGTSGVLSTATGSANQVLTANSSGIPTWADLTISAGSCTNCISSNPASLQIIQPTTDTTGLTIEQSTVATPTADIFNVTNSTGTIKYLQVDSLGNVIINNTDLQLGGTISMKTDDTNLANINDTFVYDTSSDVDGGAWGNNGNAQASSWYNETIDNTGANCVLGTDTRCGVREFPKKVTFIATNTHLYIYDDSNNTLWMTFNLGTGYAFSGTPALSSVFALNGVAYIGTSTNGLIVIDFVNDRIQQYNYNSGNGGIATFLGNISARNTNEGFGAISSWGKIAADKVNGVFARVINGKTFVAVSTLGGASVIDITDQKVNRYIDN